MFSFLGFQAGTPDFSGKLAKPVLVRVVASHTRSSTSMRSWRGWNWGDGNFGGSGLQPLKRVAYHFSRQLKRIPSTHRAGRMASDDGMTSGLEDQIRKQQFLIESGGAVLRARSELGVSIVVVWHALSAWMMVCTSMVAMKGKKSGTSALSKDWLTTWPWFWHKTVSSATISPHPGMSLS